MGDRSRASSQRGAVLFVALIVLVALLLASIALVRSVHTANVIAGNLAFKQATVQAGDLGVEVAAAALPDIVATTLDTDLTPGATGTPAYWYYATRRDADENGVPTTKPTGLAGVASPIDWNNVPVAAAIAGNSVQVVIDRLCRGPTPVMDTQANCFHESNNGGSSKKIGSTVMTSVETVYYRVTARVSGPRNTISIVQAIIGR